MGRGGGGRVGGPNKHWGRIQKIKKRGGRLFGTQECSFTRKGTHHRCFPVKFMKFYGTSF